MPEKLLTKVPQDAVKMHFYALPGESLEEAKTPASFSGRRGFWFDFNR